MMPMFDGHADLVLPNLYIGDSWAGDSARKRDDFSVLNVLEGADVDVTKHGRIPILSTDANGETRARRKQLDAAAGWLDIHWNHTTKGQKIMVHCAAGVERSPLTVAWWMRRRFGGSLDDAYAWIKAHRRIAEDRQSWIE